MGKSIQMYKESIPRKNAAVSKPDKKNTNKCLNFVQREEIVSKRDAKLLEYRLQNPNSNPFIGLLCLLFIGLLFAR
jgi:hypothetical protein